MLGYTIEHVYVARHFYGYYGVLTLKLLMLSPKQKAASPSGPTASLRAVPPEFPAVINRALHLPVTAACPSGSNLLLADYSPGKLENIYPKHFFPLRTLLAFRHKDRWLIATNTDLLNCHD
jgi:hypothetical protein